MGNKSMINNKGKDYSENGQKENNENTEIFSIAMVGATHAGKTSLCKSLFEDIFDDSLPCSTGPNFYKTQLVMNDGQEAKFEIWDTAGMSRYDNLTKLLLRNKSFYIIVFNIGSEDYFDKVSFWLNTLKEITPAYQRLKNYATDEAFAQEEFHKHNVADMDHFCLIELAIAKQKNQLDNDELA